MRRNRFTGLLAQTLMLLTLGLGVAACGGDKPATGNQQTAAQTDHEKQLKFAKCMRDNGFDMPDPEPPRADGARTGMAATNADDPSFRPAFEKCRPLLPNGGEAKPLSDEARAAALTFAKCMRANGVADYPDPSSDGRVMGPPLPNPSDPAYAAKLTALQQATEKCGGPAGAVPAG
jgi:hypothetical protein